VFTDTTKFWSASRIGARFAAKKGGRNTEPAGWSDVVVLEMGTHSILLRLRTAPEKKGASLYYLQPQAAKSNNEGWLEDKEGPNGAISNGEADGSDERSC